MGATWELHGAFLPDLAEYGDDTVREPVDAGTGDGHSIVVVNSELSSHCPERQKDLGVLH